MAAACSQTKQMDKEELLSQMSIEDKAHLAIGTGMAGFSNANSPTIGATKNLVPGAAGTTYPLDSLGIPSIVLSDGPAGLRIDPKRDGDKNTYYCTHFPIGTLLASTWNQQLVEEVGKAIGNEVKEYGADVLLAPGMNIHRNPLCGRNFEYFSEDPLLSGKMGAAVVRGVQQSGRAACPKHFACNNQETHRNINDARVSERALREIYLRNFEICVREAAPKVIMTSYNKINGVWSHYNYDLVTTVLRGQWGFDGVVITDWWMKRSKSPEFPQLEDNAYRVRAQVDILMPGAITHVERNYLSDGSLLKTLGQQEGIKKAELFRTAENVLRLLKRLP